jgi:anti-sigma regulatory factor (Ser/Thr protein kinase)
LGLTRSFDVPTTGGNAGALARRELDSLADRVDHVTLAKLRLLVSELANRAVVNGNGVGISVSVTLSSSSIRASVAEPGFGPSRRLDWALFLISRMSDRWGMTPDIWFELDLPPGREAR